MCRKLETETEKVLPFYASSLVPEEDDDVAAAMQEAPSEPLAEVNKRVQVNRYLKDDLSVQLSAIKEATLVKFRSGYLLTREQKRRNIFNFIRVHLFTT